MLAGWRDMPPGKKKGEPTMFNIDDALVQRLNNPRGTVPMRALKIRDEFVQQGLKHRLDTGHMPFGTLVADDRCVIGNTWCQTVQSGTSVLAVRLVPPDEHFGEPDQADVVKVSAADIVLVLKRVNLGPAS